MTPDRSPRPRLPLPTLLRRFLERLLAPGDRRALMSELEELYEHRRAREGEGRARRRLRREARRAVLQLIWQRVAAIPPLVARLADEVRRQPNREAISSWLRELRHGVRQLVRAPVFALTSIATVALGIGATTAVYAVVRGVLIQPLPYDEPGRLVHIYTDLQGREWGTSMADYLALAEQQTQFDAVGAYRNGAVTYTTGEGAERIPIRRVTPSLFPMLGVDPMLGRGFSDEDAEPGAEPVAVVSYGFWRARLGGDTRVIGRTIRLDGEKFTVIGVLGPEVGPVEEGREVFTALPLEPPQRKGPFFLFTIARLREDVARDAAAVELRAINDRIYPIWRDSWGEENATWAMRDLKATFVGDVGNTLVIALGSVALLLLIACTNVANLLVARGVQQRHELAVRSALGASRGRLIQHLLSEALVLALVGAALGLAIAGVGVELARSAGADFIPRTSEIGLSASTLMFYAVVTLGALLLFGLMPALQSSGAEPARDLRAGGRGGSAGTGARRLRRALVGSQFAVTLPLLAGAGLLALSLDNLHRVDPGFDVERLLTVAINLPRAGSADSTRAERRGRWDRVLEPVRAIPGVEIAGLSGSRPPAEYDFGNNFVVEGHPVAVGESQLSVPWVIATPEYFEALGVPLIDGRMFDADRDTGRVALVDRTWAERFFPNSTSVGRRFQQGACIRPDCPWWTVIGVVEDVRYTGLDDPGAGTMYLNFDQFPSTAAYLVVRARRDPIALLAPIRRGIRQIEPGAPITRAATGRELVRDSLKEPRYLTLLVVTFAAVAVTLSLVGIYGVMVYFVQGHRKDIGIRIALGGAPTTVAGNVLLNGMRLAVAGTLAGLGASLLLGRFLSGVLFQVEPGDPVALAGVSAVLLMMAAAACLVPARRAARLDPALTLREE